MTIAIVGTPAVVTQAGTSLSQSYTAAGGADILLCASQRGTSGTSPSALTFGGVDAIDASDLDPDIGPVTALCQIAASGRSHRWYRIKAASHPGAGSRTVACTWAGVDNIGVAIFEVEADGTLSVVDTNQNSSGATVAITAGSGDMTLGCAQGNSGTPAFTPTSGQTEYLESVWYNNTGHSVGVQSGAQTGANWTHAGSACASAFVLHEEAGSTNHDGVGASSLSNTGAAALTQNHQLAGAGASSLSSTGAPVLTQNHQFTAAGAESDTETGESQYGHVLTAAPTESASETGDGALTQRHLLAAAGASSTSQTGSAALTQNHQLVAEGATSSSRTGNANLNSGGGGTGDGEGKLGSSTLGIGSRRRRHVIGG